MYRHYNPNPSAKNVEDCTVRAICAATGDAWEDVHQDLCDLSRLRGNMPHANEVWGEYLQLRGWRRRYLRGDCPVCYRVRDFCREYPRGVYILGLEGHVVCVIDGEAWDTWDSTDRVPNFYWTKEER